jgi:hypothetical protein
MASGRQETVPLNRTDVATDKWATLLVKCVVQPLIDAISAIESEAASAPVVEELSGPAALPFCSARSPRPTKVASCSIDAPVSPKSR